VAPAPTKKRLDPRQYRRVHGLTVFSDRGLLVPDPIQSFADAPASIVRHAALVQAVKKPTPLAAQTWPIALAGRDVIQVAQEMSGKTMAFLVPALVHALAAGAVSESGISGGGDIGSEGARGRGPTVLILTGTSDRARVIRNEMATIGMNTALICRSLHGGVWHEPQQETLRQGADVVVATPGRLNDLLSRQGQGGSWSVTGGMLGRCGLVVLDQADRMVRLGFEAQMRSILSSIPEAQARQIILSSATWDKEVHTYFKRPQHTPLLPPHERKCTLAVT
jgi:superfamily II DNA/RNA helicase